MQYATAQCATVRELVIAAQSGTEASEPALEQLLVNHAGLCRKVVTAFQPGPVDDDLLQVARIALTAAAKTYRPASEASFATYAYAAMYRTVRKEVQRRHRDAKRLQQVPLEEATDAPDPAQESPLIQRLQRLVLHAALQALPQSDRELLKQLYWRDNSQREVAAKYGVSQAAVQKKHRRILKDLRFALSA